jgi:hypothetical protein
MLVKPDDPIAFGIGAVGLLLVALGGGEGGSGEGVGDFMMECDPHEWTVAGFPQSALSAEIGFDPCCAQRRTECTQHRRRQA